MRRFKSRGVIKHPGCHIRRGGARVQTSDSSGYSSSINTSNSKGQSLAISKFTCCLAFTSTGKLPSCSQKTYLRVRSKLSSLSSITAYICKGRGITDNPTTFCLALTARAHRYLSWIFAVVVQSSAVTWSCACMYSERSASDVCTWVYSPSRRLYSVCPGCVCFRDLLARLFTRIWLYPIRKSRAFQWITTKIFLECSRKLGKWSATGRLC